MANTTQARTCPSCGLLNPGDATTCDCGYSFATGEMTVSPLKQSAPLEEERSTWGWAWRLLLFPMTLAPLRIAVQNDADAAISTLFGVLSALLALLWWQFVWRR